MNIPLSRPCPKKQVHAEEMYSSSKKSGAEGGIIIIRIQSQYFNDNLREHRLSLGWLCKPVGSWVLGSSEFPRAHPCQGCRVFLPEFQMGGGGIPGDSEGRTMQALKKNWTRRASWWPPCPPWFGLPDFFSKKLFSNVCCPECSRSNTATSFDPSPRLPSPPMHHYLFLRPFFFFCRKQNRGSFDECASCAAQRPCGSVSIKLAKAVGFTRNDPWFGLFECLPWQIDEIHSQK